MNRPAIGNSRSEGWTIPGSIWGAPRILSQLIRISKRFFGLLSIVASDPNSAVATPQRVIEVESPDDA